MSKRIRAPKAKPGQLLAKFGKVDGEHDLFYCWPETSMKRDSRLLSHAFQGITLSTGKTLVAELESRGYDVTTFQFSIMKLPPGENE